MIAKNGIRHKGLKLLFEKGRREKVPPEYADILEYALSALDKIESIDELNDIRELRCHQLIGAKKGVYSIVISGNLRLTFRMDEESVYYIDLEDYH